MMWYIADCLVLILGCIFFWCSFTLKINIKHWLFVCGLLFILISILSFVFIPRLRILEIIIIFTFLLFWVFNLILHIIGKKSPCPYAICILGAQVTVRRISPSFEGRLKTAYKQFLRYDKTPLIIVCGGKGKEAEISEAQAGADYLNALGVPSEKIIKEETSRNTIGSLNNLLSLLNDKESRVLFTTNSWGIARVYLLSKKLGINAKTIGYKGPFLWFMCYSLREITAIIYYMIKKYSEYNIIQYRRK